jgi:chemotaxis protein CheC
MDEFTQIEVDAIAEIMNIGAGHASNALSVMTGKNIRMTVPEVKLCPVEKIPRLIGRPEDLVAAVYVGIQGRMGPNVFPMGSLMLILPHESAKELASLLQNKDGKWDPELTDIDISALEECGNILSGSSLTAVSKVLDTELVESLPNFAHDMLQAVMSFALIELAPKTKDALTFTTDFKIEGHEIKAYFLLLLAPESLALLRKKIKVLFEQMLSAYIEEEYTNA